MKFGLKSTFSEIRYIDENGACMVSEGSNSITMQVKSDGSARPRSGWGTNAHSVERTEEFYEQLE